MPSTENYKTILAGTRSFLSPLGYKKKQSTFLMFHNEAISVVNLQKSTSSDKNTFLMTVNLGVYLQRLAEKIGQPTSTSSVWECHWQQRIGELLPTSSDKWWEVNNENTFYVADEIVSILETYGIPTLKKMASLNSLVALWESGQSPGLTEMQVADYLSKLRS